jgi:hypothetical protein
LSDRI